MPQQLDALSPSEPVRPSSGDRIFYLDAMRAVLMTLGVVFHAARAYSAAGGWLVSDGATWTGFDWLAWLVHLFRMPAFFVMAGFFSMMTLKKTGAASHLRTRLERLLVPLLVTGFSINVVQVFVLDLIHGTPLPAPNAALAHRLWGILAQSQWLSHLWFLVVLIAYLPLLPLVALAGRRWPAPAAAVLDAVYRHRVLVLLGVLPLWRVALRAVGQVAPQLIHWRLFDLSGLTFLSYIPYFLAGAALFTDPRLLTFFRSAKAWQFVVVPAALALHLATRSGQNPVAEAVSLLAHDVAVWIACIWCFWSFHRLVRQGSEAWRAFSDASYSIYLFHHMTVIVLVWTLRGIAVPLGLKFALVTVAGFLVPYAIHRNLILRSRLLLWMFNGRRRAPRRERPLAAPVQVSVRAD